GLITELSPAESLPAELDALQRDMHRVFERALAIRHVDAGSCNGCELEIHALSNPYYNLEGRGIRCVARPRHADLLLVTGPVSRNMAEALQRTYAAVPDPKWVVAVGDCARCGGAFGESYACVGAVSQVIPVDAVVEGCPPRPEALLRAIANVVLKPSSAAKSYSQPPARVRASESGVGASRKETNQ